MLPSRPLFFLHPLHCVAHTHTQLQYAAYRRLIESADCQAVLHYKERGCVCCVCCVVCVVLSPRATAAGVGGERARTLKNASLACPIHPLN